MDWGGITYWHWLLLGGIFLILELLLPGVFFLWMAIPAGLLGLLLWLVPMPVSVQLLIFALAALFSVFAGRRLLNRFGGESEQPLLNERQAQYVGRTYVLEEPISNGQGRIRVGDGSWRVEGPDCETGTRVKVVRVTGATFFVEPE